MQIVSSTHFLHKIIGDIIHCGQRKPPRGKDCRGVVRLSPQMGKRVTVRSDKFKPHILRFIFNFKPQDTKKAAQCSLFCIHSGDHHGTILRPRHDQDMITIRPLRTSELLFPSLGGSVQAMLGTGSYGKPLLHDAASLQYHNLRKRVYIILLFHRSAKSGTKVLLFFDICKSYCTFLPVASYMAPFGITIYIWLSMITLVHWVWSPCTSSMSVVIRFT